MLPVALDAMGGDKAPDEIVAGAHRAVAELGVDVALVGQPEVLGPIAGDLEIIPASEVIPMSADPGSSVRAMKDSSLVRAAEAVRDGQGLGHGLGREHRRDHGLRPPAHGSHQGCRPTRPSPPRSPCRAAGPTILLDAGANAECQPDWLLQFAQMGVVFARTRYGIDAPAGRAPVDR